MTFRNLIRSIYSPIPSVDSWRWVDKIYSVYPVGVWTRLHRFWVGLSTLYEHRAWFWIKFVLSAPISRKVTSQRVSPFVQRRRHITSFFSEPKKLKNNYNHIFHPGVNLLLNFYGCRMASALNEGRHSFGRNFARNWSWEYKFNPESCSEVDRLTQNRCRRVQIPTG